MAYQLLSPGGIIAIYVPNGEGIQARHDFTSWEWRAFPDHLYYFSPLTLRRMLEQTGFQVEELWTEIGYSNKEQLLHVIRQQLHLGINDEACEEIQSLGSQSLLSDLRVVARKPRTVA